MKTTTLLIAALATFGAAAPPIKKCTPGTYSCTPDNKGWQVCNVDHTWVVSILVKLFVERDLLMVLSSLLVSVPPRPPAFSTRTTAHHTASLPAFTFKAGLP